MLLLKVLFFPPTDRTISFAVYIILNETLLCAFFFFGEKKQMLR